VSAESGTIVWHSDGATIDSDGVRQDVSAMLAQIAQFAGRQCCRQSLRWGRL